MIFHALLPLERWRRLQAEAARPIPWRVRSESLGDWALVFSPGTEMNLKEAALAHHRIVQALWERSDLLPLRFYPQLRRDALIKLVCDKEEDLQRLAQKLHGCCEIGVRVHHKDKKAKIEANMEAKLAATPGRSYLERRRDVYLQDLLLARLGERLGDALKDTLKDIGRTVRRGDFVYSTSFLTPRTPLDSFRISLEEALEAPPAPPFRLERLFGPWPPYSFSLSFRSLQKGSS